jgi:hypothetical protein
MSDLSSVIIFIGGVAILAVALLQWRQLLRMRRENADSTRRHEEFQKRMMESADLPVEQRQSFYERALAEAHAPSADRDKTNRELREENARLRAELSSRR